MRQLFATVLRNQAALEEAAAGKTEKETEHVLHGKICDHSQLEGAPWEDHEQWEIDLPKNADTGAKGRQRVRKTTTPDGQVKYVQTLKVHNAAEGRSKGEDETSVEVTEDVFNQFRRMAPKGMLKRRYMVPIEGKEKPWEIDVFPKEDGGWHPDCKIDLEVPSLEAPLPKLPITLSDLVTKPYGQRSEAEEKYVSGLYNNVFRMSREQIDKINAVRAQNTTAVPASSATEDPK